jgi:hypothetical protein
LALLPGFCVTVSLPVVPKHILFKDLLDCCHEHPSLDPQNMHGCTFFFALKSKGGGSTKIQPMSDFLSFAMQGLQWREERQVTQILRTCSTQNVLESLGVRLRPALKLSILMELPNFCSEIPNLVQNFVS